MRYRDLETGTFLTRDPIGYADGPNVYCYVHCNPITSFDPLGLSETAATQVRDMLINVVTDNVVKSVENSEAFGPYMKEFVGKHQEEFKGLIKDGKGTFSEEIDSYSKGQNVKFIYDHGLTPGVFASGAVDVKVSVEVELSLTKDGVVKVDSANFVADYSVNVEVTPVVFVGPTLAPVSVKEKLTEKFSYEGAVKRPLIKPASETGAGLKQGESETGAGFKPVEPKAEESLTAPSEEPGDLNN